MEELKKILISLSFASMFLAGCVTNSVKTVVDIENAKSVTVNNPDNDTTELTIKKSSARQVTKKIGFSYLSKMTLEKGPCPERDPSSYGLLMKSKTTTQNGKLICYYN